MKIQVRKWLSLLLMALTILSVAGCSLAEAERGWNQVITEGMEALVTPEQTTPTLLPTATPEPEPEATIDEDGWYYSKEDVGLYLYIYGRLPDNYITKGDARELGWTGGNVERFKKGGAIGGDFFQNREELLPKAEGRQYYECDIDTDGGRSRGARRIVYSNDGLIYFTEDHYRSFTLLYGEEK